MTDNRNRLINSVDDSLLTVIGNPLLPGNFLYFSIIQHVRHLARQWMAERVPGFMLTPHHILTVDLE